MACPPSLKPPKPLSAPPLPFPPIPLPPFSAPPPSSSSLASTPAVAVVDQGQKPSKKRKLKAVVDALRSDNPSAPAAAPVAIRQPQQQNNPAQPARVGMMSTSSSESLAGKPNSEDKGPEDLDLSGSISRPNSNSQASQLVPSKKVLEGILDKLQKKDTYGVFSEPVDSQQVPDYYDVIKDPMDFGTMRKRIAVGGYVSLELFQKDILLICSNAMRYNAKDTIYYKQARSIQDAARKMLDALKATGSVLEVDDEVMVKQKPGGSSIKKSHKKQPLVKSWFEPTGSDYTSGATLATGGESGGKGATSDRSGSAGWNVEAQAGNIWSIPGTTNPFAGSPSETKADNQDDLAGSLLKSMVLKDGRRLQVSEENRRSTYRPRNISSQGNGPVLATIGGELQQLVPVGHQPDLAYARSLARFAAGLGPVVWKIAAEKIRRALPPGLPFGPGWVGEQEAPPGALLPPLNKGPSNQLPRVEPKVAVESRQYNPGEEVQSKKEISLKGNISQPIPSVVFNAGVSVPLSKTVCLSESTSPATVTAPVPLSEHTGSLQHAAILQNNSQNFGEPSQSSPTRANFPLDTLQSKRVETSQDNILVSWTSAKQAERVPLSSQPRMSVSEKYFGEKQLEGNVSKEAEDYSKLASKLNNSNAATGSSVAKHGFNGGGSQAVWQSQATSSEDQFLQDRSLLSSGSQRHQIAHSNSNASLGASSLAFSSVVPTSSGTVRGREDAKVHGWMQSQHSDLSQVAGSARVKLQSQLPGNTAQSQSMGSSQFNAQLHEAQARLGHQQQRYQVGLASQHGSQKLPPNVPQFLQHQFADVQSYVQQQQARLHPQGSLKPVAPIHSGGPGDSQDPSMLRHSHFSAQMGAGVTQSQNRLWQYAAPKFSLQQGSNLSLSSAPDLNVTLPPTKSPFDQSNNNVNESQQPDLALQL